jgi:hypothetical protein
MEDFNTRFPCYNKAASVATCAPDEQSIKIFVNANKPCVLPQFGKDHPIIEQFSSEERIKNHLMKVMKEEKLVCSIKSFTYFAGPEYSYSGACLTHSELFKRWDEGLRARLVLPLPKNTQPLNASALSFLPLSSTYGSRAFFYRFGFTDWHYHHRSEHFTMQVWGTKEVLLLPDSEEIFFWMMKHLKNGGGWNIAESGKEDLPLLKVTLNPGDVLYIPPKWWHLVVPTDDVCGVTAAFVFDEDHRKTFSFNVVHFMYNMIFGGEIEKDGCTKCCKFVFGDIFVCSESKERLCSTCVKNDPCCADFSPKKINFSQIGKDIAVARKNDNLTDDDFKKVSAQMLSFIHKVVPKERGHEIEKFEEFFSKAYFYYYKGIPFH